VPSEAGLRLGPPQTDAVVTMDNSADKLALKRASGRMMDQPSCPQVREIFSHFKAAFEGAVIGMALIGPDGRFLEVNPALCDLYGRSRRELLQHGWQDLTHPDDVGPSEELGRRLRDGDLEFASTETRGVRVDGSIFWTLTSICVLTDDRGTPACFFAQVFDVTEHKEGEAALGNFAATVDLLKRVATCANDSDNVTDALETTLAEVCAYMGWPAGHVLLKRDDSEPYVDSARIWHLRQPERFAEFKRITESLRFVPGVGLPGEVLATGQPAWMEDYFSDAGLPRSEIAKSAGIRAGIAFPILVGSDVAGVVEFFSFRPHVPDTSLLEAMAQIGIQLGRVFEREQAREALRSNERRTRLILDTASDAFIEIDEKGIVRTWNHQAERTFGFSREEVIGTRLSETIIPLRYRSSHERGLENFLATGSGPALHKPMELTALHKDGHEFPVELTIWPVSFGSSWSFNAFVRDITDRVELQQELVRLSSLDELTGLMNRRAFLELAEPQLKLSKRMNLALTLLFIDLDSMKQINDTLGHLQGDNALKDLASLLKSVFRESDIVARVGGDEFCVLEASSESGLDPSVQRFNSAVATFNEEHQRPYLLSVSVGAAFFDPKSPSTIEQLIDEADRSMYQEKYRRRTENSTNE
jgi:diguanylate cyclase (GGDEF)-like protein/PAS domain S-box-containing protein